MQKIFTCKLLGTARGDTTQRSLKMGRHGGLPGPKQQDGMPCLVSGAKMGPGFSLGGLAVPSECNVFAATLGPNGLPIPPGGGLGITKCAKNKAWVGFAPV